MVSEQRNKRSLEAELGLDQPEGSGTEPSFFNGTGKSQPRRRKAPSAPDAASLSLSLSLAEACKAAPDTGPCFGSFQHYFYNSSSMSCELFNYGGCLGNQNNFKNERECLQRCRTEGEEHITCVNQIPEDMDQISQNKGKLLRFSLLAVFFCSISSAVCRLPMSPQPCSGQLPIWAFDSSAGLCVPYKVGICQTNANKFYSKAECEEYCGKTEEDGEIKKKVSYGWRRKEKFGTVKVHISAL